MVSTTVTALTIAVLAEVFVVAGIGLSVVKPEYRIWPPEEMNWRFWYYWGGSAVVFAALVVVGYETAESFVLRHVIWDAVGGLLTLTGLAFAGWAGYVFRVSESFGIEGELHTEGPYKYTRNPQYVGMYVSIVGVMLVVNSLALIVGFIPVFVWIYLLPLAEEPWLEEEFGEEYEEYT
ncbi:MAG: methyltransferase, partial [Halobacteria archaeon]|nr:methyltransferase [Halobacteria archaeon]